MSAESIRIRVPSRPYGAVNLIIYLVEQRKLGVYISYTLTPLIYLFTQPLIYVNCEFNLGLRAYWVPSTMKSRFPVIDC